MKFFLEKKILAGLLGVGIILIALGFLYFEPSGTTDEGVIGLIAACTIFLVYLLFAINGTLKNQHRLEEHILQLKANVGERTLKQIENEKIYRSLAANIPGSAITILDREERYLLAEGDMLAGMSYTKENMPGRKISDVITPENYTWYKVLIDEAFSGKTLIRERRTLSGLDALIKVVPLKNEEGIIYAIMFVLLDVTVVKKVQSELAELNNSLELKITERTEQLMELNEQLEGFSYSVSHDLRAPLRAISGFGKIIQEDHGAKLNDDGRFLLEQILEKTVRMNQLIDDLLNFSKLGRTELQRSRIDMDDLVKEILAELMPSEESRKLNIHHHPLTSAYGDANMMRQVWINLISNALKYTRKKETADIEIRSDHENGSILYSIKDNGAGFDMNYADKLFGVFQRLHTMKDFEGTGVGLALVRTIIKRHGGKIWAEAKVNEGAKFYFTLPDNTSSKS